MPLPTSTESDLVLTSDAPGEYKTTVTEHGRIDALWSAAGTGVVIARPVDDLPGEAVVISNPPASAGPSTEVSTRLQVERAAKWALAWLGVA